MDLRKLIVESINLYKNGHLEKCKLLLEKILKKDPNNPDALRLLGDIYLHKKIYKEAIFNYEKSIAIFKNQPFALNNCGLCYLNIGLYDHAINLFDLSFRCNEDYEDALFNKAYVQNLKGDYLNAIDTYKQIVLNNTKYVDAYFKLAAIYANLNKFSSAYETLNTLLSENPEIGDALFYQERSLYLLNLGRVDDAIKDLNISLDKDPNLKESYVNRGNIYKDLKYFDKALNDYNKAISLNSKSWNSFNGLGNLYKDMGRFDEALDCYNKAISLSVNELMPRMNKVVLYRDTGKFDDAINEVNAIIDANPANDDFYKAKADIYLAMGSYENAINCFDQAIKINPIRPMLYCERGLLNAGLGKFEEAESDYEIIISGHNEPSIAQRFNHALLNLSRKFFEKGWDDYKIRKKLPEHSLAELNSLKPLWDGKDYDKRVYLSNEQGLGDEIFFTGMLDDVIKSNNKIILSVSPRLESLYRRSFPGIDIYPVNLNVKERPLFLSEEFYDYHLPLGDLGSIYRKDIECFNNQKRGYLKADINKTNNYKNLLSEEGKILCGIAWKSSAKEGAFKSLKIENLAPFFKMQKLKFVNLQYGSVEADLESIKQNYNIDIKNINELDYYNDIDSLASLIEACDFIITSSNVTAHIAGALGKETYLLAPYGKGKLWYWHENQGASLWYPSVKIIDQISASDPLSSINNIAALLERKINEKH